MNKPMTQEEHFQRFGYYDRMQKPPTKEEAIQHAVNQIQRAFGKKK